MTINVVKKKDGMRNEKNMYENMFIFFFLIQQNIIIILILFYFVDVSKKFKILLITALFFPVAGNELFRQNAFKSLIL